MKRFQKTLMIVAGGLVAGGLLLTLGETCRWWRMWRRSAIQAEASDYCTAPRKAILWLSGVSDYGDSEWMPEQRAFVERLAVLSPGSVAVQGNAPASKELDTRYRRGDVWRIAGLGRPPLWAWVLHNYWQFALASVCEHSYGRDMAQAIVWRLRMAGALVGSPVLLVCGSAGAQVGLASAPFLNAAGYGPIYMAVLGGEFGSPHGLEAVTRFAQLVGEKDVWGKVGAWVFPGRWLPASRCARACKEGRLTQHSIGPHGHFGVKSYLDDENILPNGRTYAGAAIEAIVQLPWWQEWAEL